VFLRNFACESHSCGSSLMSLVVVFVARRPAGIKLYSFSSSLEISGRRPPPFSFFLLSFSFMLFISTTYVRRPGLQGSIIGSCLPALKDAAPKISAQRQSQFISHVVSCSPFSVLVPITLTVTAPRVRSYSYHPSGNAFLRQRYA
jgi:hypothetical protein